MRLHHRLDLSSKSHVKTRFSPTLQFAHIHLSIFQRGRVRTLLLPGRLRNNFTNHNHHKDMTKPLQHYAFDNNICAHYTDHDCMADIFL